MRRTGLTQRAKTIRNADRSIRAILWPRFARAHVVFATRLGDGYLPFYFAYSRIRRSAAELTRLQYRFFPLAGHAIAHFVSILALAFIIRFTLTLDWVGILAFHVRLILQAPPPVVARYSAIVAGRRRSSALTC